MTDEEITQLAINTIRTLSMDAVQQAKFGHPATPMALAPLNLHFGKNVWSIGPAKRTSEKVWLRAGPGGSRCKRFARQKSARSRVHGCVIC
jgi:Transketolase, thiamine diphosphate binding domain